MTRQIHLPLVLILSVSILSVNPALAYNPADLAKVAPGADLTGADLTFASLNSADLTGAHLNGADLRSADLRFINLLTGAFYNSLTKFPVGFDPIAAGLRLIATPSPSPSTSPSPSPSPSTSTGSGSGSGSGSGFGGDSDPQSVPEPISMIGMFLGLGGLFLSRRARNKKLRS